MVKMKTMPGFAKLQEEVINTGLCVNCGTCIGVCPSKCLIANYQTEVPQSVKECPPHCQICYEVCPAKDIPIPEMERLVFGRNHTAEEEARGIDRGYYKAWATDQFVRGRGASGGFCTALMIYALEKDIIDAAILCGVSEKEPWIGVPKIATTRNEVIACQETKNYRAPTYAVLSEALEKGYKRLGVIGLPYHAWAYRKMQMGGKLTRLLQSIKFMVGLFQGTAGGGGATRAMHEHLIEEVLRVPLDEVAEVTLHGHRYPGLYAVTTKDGRTVAVRDGTRHTHWRGFPEEGDRVGYDGTAELADLSTGGYMGPEARRGVSGWNIVIVRTDIGEKLLKDAEAAGYIGTEPMDKNKLAGTMNVPGNRKWEARYTIIERRKFGHPMPDYHLPEELLQHPKRIR